jgi:hypothetical protein
MHDTLGGMTREEALAAGLKLVAALPVLRWPLAGAIIAILADGLDVVVMNYVDLGGGGIRDYHLFDKWTDLFALVTFFIVSLRWEGRDRALAGILFALRLTGITLFEVLGWRGALIFLPNLFETWFLFVLIRDAWLPKDSSRLQGLLLSGLVACKLVQEYVLHGAQILDRYSLSEVLDRLWGR